MEAVGEGTGEDDCADASWGETGVEEEEDDWTAASGEEEAIEDVAGAAGVSLAESAWSAVSALALPSLSPTPLSAPEGPKEKVGEDDFSPLSSTISR